MICPVSTAFKLAKFSGTQIVEPAICLDMKTECWPLPTSGHFFKQISVIPNRLQANISELFENGAD
jgi:hypothetical protein